MSHLIDYYFNPTHKILGEDKWMVTNRHHNYFSQYMLFEEKIPNIDSHLQSVVCRWFSDPRSIFRAFVSSGKNTYDYDRTPSKVLCERFLHRVKTISIEQVETYAIEHESTAVLFYTDRGICFCCHHLFFDGVKAYNKVQELFDFDHRFRVNNFTYIPAVHEMGVLLSSGHFLFPTQRYLTYDVDYHTSGEYRPLRMRHRLSVYKNIKRRSIKKLAFASVLISKMLYHLFRVSGVTMLSFGVLVGMNSKCRFNNYGVVACEISHPFKNEGPIAFANRVHETIERRKKMTVASFIGSNVYGMDMKYGEIDILFSGMPMTLDEPISIRGSRLAKVESNMRYTSMPIYCGYLSCDRYVHLYFNIRTNMINNDALAHSLGRNQT